VVPLLKRYPLTQFRFHILRVAIAVLFHVRTQLPILLLPLSAGYPDLNANLEQGTLLRGREFIEFALLVIEPAVQGMASGDLTIPVLFLVLPQLGEPFVPGHRDRGSAQFPGEVDPVQKAGTLLR